MLLMGKREVNVFLTREVIQSYELAGPAACTACSRRRMTVRNKPSNSKEASLLNIGCKVVLMSVKHSSSPQNSRSDEELFFFLASLMFM